MSKGNHTAQKAHREQMKAHPERFVCDCGRVGFIMKSGEVVCKRCHDYEVSVWAVRGDLRGYAERSQAA